MSRLITQIETEWKTRITCPTGISQYIENCYQDLYSKEQYEENLRLAWLNSIEKKIDNDKNDHLTMPITHEEIENALLTSDACHEPI